jgi:hypothetical protein
MGQQFAADVASGSEGRLVQLLTKLGATDVQRLELGYVVWTGVEEQLAVVKQCRGMRAVWPVTKDEVETMINTASAGSGITVGETVRVFRGAMALVGQITSLDHGKAKMLTPLFGRPTEVEISIAEAEVLPLPETWR